MFSLSRVLCFLGVFISTAHAEDQGLLERANSAYRSSRLEEAASLYQTYLANHPGRADVRVYLGAALLGLGKHPHALEQARLSIELNPTYAKGYALAGRVYADLQKWSVAEEFFSKALALDPDDRDIAYFFGRALCSSNRFDRAVDVLLRASRASGAHSRVYQQLGLAYDSLRETEKAETAYQAALKAIGNSHRSYLAYGMFLFQHARLDESIAVLRKAFALEPRDASVRYELGRALLQNGQTKDSIVVLKSLNDGSDCRIHRLLAKALEIEGDSQTAAVELKRTSACTAASGQ